MSQLERKLTEYIKSNYNGKFITKEDAINYCPRFVVGVYNDEISTITEGYIEEKDLIGIYLFDEKDFPNRKYTL